MINFDKTPKPQEIWSYTYPDGSKVEYIITSLGSMKINEGHWIESVNYQSTVNGLIYTRDRWTFLKKFIYVPTEKDMVAT